jgi:sulfate adenylyltransferase subunit 1
MELLRFFTAGNVDDGKSTLIGRLLYDSESVSTDIIETLTRQSKVKNGDTEIDLALLTDGLRAEREQGITIDVAYKYFSTSRRKFIIADTPGHIQYTRNMFTGSSNADLAIILVDARHGLTDQTKRHTIISSILQIQKVVVCVNKMDLVNYSENVFNEILEEFRIFAHRLSLEDISFIPVSALTGENVVNGSLRMNWYEGPALLELLENTELPKQKSPLPRFQVQYVIRPQSEDLHDYRGYAGRVLSGKFSKGDKVLILPNGFESKIEKIERNLQETDSAETGDSIVLHFSDDIDISRGNTVVPGDKIPETEKEFDATICWMDQDAFRPGQKFILQQGSFQTKAIIKEISAIIDIHSFGEKAFEGQLKLNDISRVKIKTAELISFDAFADNKSTGAFILINENTNNTVAAGTIGGEGL